MSGIGWEGIGARRPERSLMRRELLKLLALAAVFALAILLTAG